MKRRAFLLILALLLCASITLPDLPARAASGDAGGTVPEGAAPDPASSEPAASTGAESAEPEYATIEPGDSCYGAAVIQARLIRLGDYAGPLDNVLNEESIAALKVFQARNGLAADGVATPELQRALLAEGALDAAGEPVPAFDPDADWPEGVCIGNRNSHRFHRPECPSVDEMKESNKIALLSREGAMESGYAPCQRCLP